MATKSIHKNNILAISGSTRPNSVNELILKWFSAQYESRLNVTIYNQLASLPHFQSDLTENNVPEEIKRFYRLIEEAEGVVFCSPEYIFSLPGAFKNALEWTVSTTLFTDKPVGMIVASSLGEKAFDELQLIMQTLGASTGEKSRLLISGVKSKFSADGHLLATELAGQFDDLVDSLVSDIDDIGGSKN